MNWATLPRARTLLADIAQNPPSRRWAPTHETLDGGQVYGWRYSQRDPRVKELFAIQREAFTDAINMPTREERRAACNACPEAAEAITRAIAGEPKGELAKQALGIIRRAA